MKILQYMICFCILLVFQTNAVATVTVEDAIQQSRVAPPDKIKNANSYNISTSRVNEPQTSVVPKKSTFIEYSSGGETTATKVIRMQPTSTYICSLSKVTGFYGRGLKGTVADVFQANGWWYLKSGRASCGGCSVSADAICWTR